MSDARRQLRYRDYLGHMLEAVRLARSYTEGLSKADFLADKRTQQAVILNLLTLGEAATHIVRDAPDFPERYPSLPWKEMRGMRNRMAHGYFAIDLDIVWDTVQQPLPELERKLVAVERAAGSSDEN